MQENTHPRSLKSWQLALSGAIILLAGIADGIIKAVALRQLPGEQAAHLQPVFALAIHKNPGILFDIPLSINIIAPLTIAALVGLSIFAWQARDTRPIVSLAAFSAFIGALNNLIDRLIHGFTTDYLIILRTSAINLSDVLIFLGIVLLLCYSRPNSPAPQT